MKTSDNTAFSIPPSVNEIDVYIIGDNLIEVHSTCFDWKSSVCCSVMELKRYAKAKLGFQQATSNKWRWSRPSEISRTLEDATSAISRIHDAYCDNDEGRLDAAIIDAMDIVDNN